jgi:hypothetical protein
MAEDEAGKYRADAEDERQQHDQRAFMRVITSGAIIVMRVVMVMAWPWP